jgi:two-component system sensor histidine kinase CreC
VAFYFFVDWIVRDLTPQYREATEEPLVDSARVLAELAAASVVDGEVELDLFRVAFSKAYETSFRAKIYGLEKNSVDFRVYLTDEKGIVIFDSDSGRDEGKDYSLWRDVALTLQGQYGARTSRDTPRGPDYSVLYVAAPIVSDGKLIGVLSVGKPTENANRFIYEAKRKIVFGCLTGGALILFLVFFLSEMISRPIRALTDYANSLRSGKRGDYPQGGSAETRELAEAFEAMREALDGKQYIENYVQTLTHEIKSPLSAVQGAVELLQEDVPIEQRKRFLGNILGETHRIKEIVDKLLLLSSLENRQAPEDVEDINVVELLGEVEQSMSPLLSSRSIAFSVCAEGEYSIRADRFLLRHAVENLIHNAVDFTPQGGKVEIVVSSSEGMLTISVLDSGSGIPDYAVTRVFERFYSLNRPGTGKKSSGLGLSLVKEVAELHRGTLSVRNRDIGGVCAILSLPLSK